MFIKLAIIAGIVVLGCMVFSNEIYSIFPTTSTTVADSLMSDVTILGERASDTITQEVGGSIDRAINDTSNIINDGIDMAGEKIDRLNPLQGGQAETPSP